MDYLRHAYSSSMRMFIDDVDVLVAGRWRPCDPEYTTIPFPHTFTSTVYLDRGTGLDEEIGEVVAPKYSIPWKSQTCITGWDFVGAETVWQEGESIENQGSLILAPGHNFPLACLVEGCMSLRVEEYPSAAGFDDINLIQFDELSGFIVASAGANGARILALDATHNQRGLVGVGNQTWSGLKNIKDGIWTAFIQFGALGTLGNVQDIDSGVMAQGIGPGFARGLPGSTNVTASLAGVDPLFILRHTGSVTNPAYAVYDNDGSGTLRLGAWDTISGIQVCGGLVIGGSVVVSAGDVTGLDSAVQGVVAAQLVAGSNITITPGPGGTLSLSASVPAAYDDDDARNAVAVVLTDNTETEWTIGSGVSSIALGLVDTGVTPGEYQSVTVNSKGRVTAGRSLDVNDLPHFDDLPHGAAIDGDDSIPFFDDTAGANAGILFRDLLDQLVVNLTPSGTIIAFGGSTTPSGWLRCDGSAVSRSTYASLFTAIGSNYGPGDGSTTFNVPDFRGRSPIGSGTGSGLSPRTIGAQVGAETVALTSGENGAHSHNALSPDTGFLTYQGGAQNLSVVGGSLSFQLRGTTDPSGSGDPHNNMQPSLVAMFLIRI